MTFYDTVRNPGQFCRKASAGSAQNFETLRGSAEWKTAASSWGIQHLFACRVICTEPCHVLPIIADTVKALEKKKDEWHAVIQELIQGPHQKMSVLGRMSEVDILHAYLNRGNGLGHLWAMLAPLVDPESASTDRQMQERSPSQSAEEEESRESSQMPTPSTSTTGLNPSSIGYYEIESEPPVEDMTVRFASGFIRQIIAFCQLPGKALQTKYRDTRMPHKRAELKFCAIDDGGVQVSNTSGDVYQVALFEAKRAFQTIQNGRPTISDGLLGQIVGEALGTIASESSIFRNQVIVILAIKHFVKFFSFTVSEQFMSQFKTMNPADRGDPDSYLRVDSTQWFDVTNERGRLKIISHVMALVECADDVVAPEEDE